MGGETVPADVPQQMAASPTGLAGNPGQLNAVVMLRGGLVVATSMRGGCGL